VSRWAAGEAATLGVWAAVDAYRAVMAEASVADLAGTGRGAHYLRAMALESVIAERMQARVTVSIHHALAAGVGVSEIAEAVGMEPWQVARRWMSWAQGQRRLWAETGLLGMSEDDHARVLAVLDPTDKDASVAEPWPASASGTDK
jgi:hypothetical protein